mmetsp:Transcript_21522/g.66376  ORF Transcript_21522/g.66376 Transcript_21522/m.66376 type:complete len:243 (+) Transcript_21522:365-1093(+)
MLFPRTERRKGGGLRRATHSPDTTCRPSIRVHDDKKKKGLSCDYLGTRCGSLLFCGCCCCRRLRLIPCCCRCVRCYDSATFVVVVVVASCSGRRLEAGGFARALEDCGARVLAEDGFAVEGWLGRRAVVALGRRGAGLAVVASRGGGLRRSLARWWLEGFELGVDVAEALGDGGAGLGGLGARLEGRQLRLHFGALGALPLQHRHRLRLQLPFLRLDVLPLLPLRPRGGRLGRGHRADDARK